MTGSDLYYTAEDVAERTQFTVETVWRRCRMFQDGDPAGWPHRRAGRSIRFSRDDLDAIDHMMRPQPRKHTSSGKRKPLTPARKHKPLTL